MTVAVVLVDVDVVEALLVVGVVEVVEVLEVFKVVEVVVDVDDVDNGAVTVPNTQTCCPATSWEQFTVGFKATSSAWVMPQTSAMEAQVSPLLAVTA